MSVFRSGFSVRPRWDVRHPRDAAIAAACALFLGYATDSGLRAFTAHGAQPSALNHAAPAASHLMSWSDTEFPQANWTSVVLFPPSTSGSADASLRDAAVGNPEPSRSTVHTFSGDGTNIGVIRVFHSRTPAWVIDPGASAITALKYDFDVQQPQDFAEFVNGEEIAVHFAVRQGGRTFLGPVHGAKDNTWSHYSGELTASAFVEASGAEPDLQPDFSCEGGPITIGYVTGNSTHPSAPGSTRIQKMMRIDNLVVSATVDPAPCQGCVVGNDFNNPQTSPDGSIDGWNPANATLTVGGPDDLTLDPNGNPTTYIHATDGSGASRVYAPRTLNGDWLKMAECGRFCFDIRIVNDAKTGSIDHTPYFYLESVTKGTAKFESTVKASEAAGANPGWHKVCAPLQEMSGPLGTWTVVDGVGPLSAILSTVTGLWVPVDWSSSAIEEVVDYDNFCLIKEACDDCCEGKIGVLESGIRWNSGATGYTITGNLHRGTDNVKKVTADLVSASQTFAPGCGTSGPLATYFPNGSNTHSGSASTGLISAYVPPPITDYSRLLNLHWLPSYLTDLPFSLDVTLPPSPGWPCRDSVTLCVRYTIEYDDCTRCEMIQCYTHSRRGKIIWEDMMQRAPVGEPFPVQPRLAIAGDDERHIPAARGRVELEISPTSGAGDTARLTGTTTAELVDGVATFTDVGISTAGTDYVLVATFFSADNPELVMVSESNPFSVGQGPVIERQIVYLPTTSNQADIRGPARYTIAR